MKELKIGEEIRIRCVEGVAYSCRDCAIGKIVDNPHCANLCSPTYRTDGKNVHFEIVEDNECPSDETIMRVLNCIGYEERSWIDTVKKNWRKQL